MNIIDTNRDYTKRRAPRSRNRGSIGRVMLLPITLAVTGYLAQPILYGTSPPAGSNPAFVRASEESMRHADGAWAGGPRECELLKGISTSCLFLD